MRVGRLRLKNEGDPDEEPPLVQSTPRSSTKRFQSRSGPPQRRLSVVIVALVLVLLLPVVVLSPPTLSGPATEPRPSYINKVCPFWSWRTSHLIVGTNGCYAAFYLSYVENVSDWNTSKQYNYSFAIPWVAEINASGGIVRNATTNPPQEFPNGTVTTSGWVSVGPQYVNLTLNQTLNVTASSGRWTPADAYGSWEMWKGTNATIGTANLSVTFQLPNAVSSSAANTTWNGTCGANIDVALTDWPWASPDDRLGIGFESGGTGEIRSGFNSTSQTFSELWNVTNQTTVSLAFGGQAAVAYPAARGAVTNVSFQSLLYPSYGFGIVLLTFGDVQGNYSSLSYDPYFEFTSGTTVPPLSHPLGSLSSVGWLIVATASAAFLAILLLAVLSNRQRRLRRESEELVAGMNRIISEGTSPPRAP